MSALDIAADFIRKHEGCILTAYRDQGGVWTIGYGATGADVTEGTVWTLEQAENRLQSDCAKVCTGVAKLVIVQLTDKQSAAIISFAFNLGVSALAHSTLLTLLNQRDFMSTAQEFIRWCRVGSHEKVKGLLIRRLHEAALFLEGTP